MMVKKDKYIFSLLHSHIQDLEMVLISLICSPFVGNSMGKVERTFFWKKKSCSLSFFLFERKFFLV